MVKKSLLRKSTLKKHKQYKRVSRKRVSRKRVSRKRVSRKQKIIKNYFTGGSISNRKQFIYLILLTATGSPDQLDDLISHKEEKEKEIRDIVDKYIDNNQLIVEGKPISSLDFKTLDKNDLNNIKKNKENIKSVLARMNEESKLSKMSRNFETRARHAVRIPTSRYSKPPTSRYSKR